MNKLTSEELKEITTNRYFANVDKKNLEGVLATLNEDATIKIITDHLTHTGRDTEISNMLKGYFDAYPILWHGNFRTIIDDNKQSIVLKFDWKIKDRDDKEESGSNVNVFYFDNNKISSISIYMSSENNPLK